MSVGAGVARPAAHERAHRLDDLIVKAMRARRPQARYRADFMSWIVTVPRIPPDNPFDRLVMAQTQ